MAGDDNRKRRPTRASRPKRRPGLPDEASVVSETTLRSPPGTTYRILRTNEKDPYERGGGRKKPRG